MAAKEIATEQEAELNELRKELAKSVTGSRYLSREPASMTPRSGRSRSESSA